MERPQSRDRSTRPPLRADGGREESDEAGGEQHEETGDTPEVERLLCSAGVLEETTDGTDLRLTDEFAAAWHERIDQLRGGNRAVRWLAAAEGIDPDELSVRDGDDRFVVTHDGETVGAWHSRAGFLAAIVTEPTIREWVEEDRLDQLPEMQREELAARLVMCLEQCPACGEALAFVDRDDGEAGIALTCQSCRATVAVSAVE